MTTGMPELGSKISLISKADIRYEGRLFTVDPQECTIALASVRSFGTEDRETQYPVPAQNQIYDYILFRGSDIKDIRVVNNVSHPQPLNDPAIMQLSVPPTLGGQQFQSHPVLGHMGAQMGQFSQYSMGLGIGPGPAGLAIQAGATAAAAGLRQSKPNLIGGGTRSTTPASLGSRKSPTNDRGVQAGGSRDGAGSSGAKKPMKPIQPPGGQRAPQRPKSRERRDSGRVEGGQDSRPHQAQPINRQQNHNRQGGYGGGYQGQNQQYHQMQQRQQGGWRQPPPMAGPSAGGGGGRPRGRPRGGGGGGFRGPQGQPQPQASKKNMLKFEKDYDFEQANKEYEEIKNKFSKVKLDEVKPEVNGDVDKKDDSGNETGAGETEQDEDHEIYYDKTKSFFDKISCEAVERAKGKSQRTDWRTERKLNSETFGVAATRRGNYRGRGGFRGGYRGGFRGGYRQQRRDNNQIGNQLNQQGRSNQQQPQTLNTNQQQQQASQDDINKKERRPIEVWTSNVSNVYDRQARQLTADDNTIASSTKSESEISILQGGSDNTIIVVDEPEVRASEVPVELQ